MANLLRRALSAVAATTALVFLASCVTFSLHPLYDGTNSVFEPGLIGSWSDPSRKDNPPKFVFEKASDNSYKLTISDPTSDLPEDEVFEVHLVKLNGRLFFDAVQTGALVGGKETHLEFGIPSHLIGRISLDGDIFHYDPLDETWLKKGFESGKITIPHELAGDGEFADVVLTASTADLQKFVSAHASDDGAFPPSETLHRVK